MLKSAAVEKIYKERLSARMLSEPRPGRLDERNSRRVSLNNLLNPLNFIPFSSRLKLFWLSRRHTMSLMYINKLAFRTSKGHSIPRCHLLLGGMRAGGKVSGTAEIPSDRPRFIRVIATANSYSSSSPS